MNKSGQVKKKAFSYDSYNQALLKELCQTIKAVQGGDDVPRVVIYEKNNGSNPKD